MPIHTVTIVGVGLIGGSFGLALRKHGFAGRILGVSSARTLQAAVARGAIDEGVSLDEGVRQADLIYLSQPIAKIIAVLPAVKDLARKDALITDAGSTKAAIASRASELFHEGPLFIGGHPMAGKEQRGVERADPDLFQGATYVLTPLGEQLPSDAIVGEFLGWIGRIGARSLVLPPQVHDEIVTWTSHLPQLVSSALAACVVEQLNSESHLRVAGPGLQDMTRLAESPYEIWRDILSTNRPNLDRALTVLRQELSRLQEGLASGGLEQEFQRARNARKKLQTGQKP